MAATVVKLAVVGSLVLTLAGCERLMSDAATRLAYQIRDEAAALRQSGAQARTFTHQPLTWPEGVSGDYRVEIIEYETAPRSGHRSIGIARGLTERTWYTTSYHLNYVDVPQDVAVAHRRGEPTLVTLELKDGKVLLTRLQ
jgi:hypothetical protein